MQRHLYLIPKHFLTSEENSAALKQPLLCFPPSGPDEHLNLFYGVWDVVLITGEDTGCGGPEAWREDASSRARLASAIQPLRAPRNYVEKWEHWIVKELFQTGICNILKSWDLASWKCYGPSSSRARFQRPNSNVSRVLGELSEWSGEKYVE